MTKHQWSVLCRRSIIDKDDNSISLIDELEEITVMGQFSKEAINRELAEKNMKSASPFGFQLVSLWIRSDRDTPEIETVQVVVKNSQGRSIHTVGFDINLSKTVRTRHILRFGSVPFDGPGAYVYATQQNKGTDKKPRWVTVSELTLDVKSAEESVES